MYEIAMSIEEARDFVKHNEGYGSTRLYGIIGEGDSIGQIVGIKSEYHLDRIRYVRLYLVSRDPHSAIDIGGA